MDETDGRESLRVYDLSNDIQSTFNELETLSSSTMWLPFVLTKDHKRVERSLPLTSRL